MFWGWKQDFKDIPTLITRQGLFFLEEIFIHPESIVRNVPLLAPIKMFCHVSGFPPKGVAMVG